MIQWISEWVRDVVLARPDIFAVAGLAVAAALVFWGLDALLEWWAGRR